MRVLHVTPYYADAWGYGGIPRVAAALCEALARRGHQVEVLTTDARDGERRLGPRRLRASPPRRDAAGVSIHVLPNLSNRLAYRRQFFWPLGLGRWLDEHLARFDLVHVHGHHHLLSTEVTRAAARRGLPYLVAPNGIAPRREGQRLKKLGFDLLCGRHVLPGAARVLAVSAAEAGDLRALGVPAARIRELPNPVGADAPPARAPGGPDVLYLGTLLARKCVPTLVEALAELAGTTLWIAGNDLGDERRVRATRARLGLDARVRLLGQVEGPRRFDLLASARVVAYPGRDEAFGLVPLEALSCGTPVVVGDDAGCGEQIRALGGGLLVRPGDPSALAGALRAILSDPEGWRAQAASSGARVRRELSASAVAARLEGIYGELAT